MNFLYFFSFLVIRGGGNSLGGRELGVGERMKNDESVKKNYFLAKMD